MEDLEKRVRRVIAHELGLDWGEVGLTDNFVEDLGADSLDTVEIVMALEETFDLDIRDEEAEGLRTVGDVADFLAAKVGDR